MTLQTRRHLRIGAMVALVALALVAAGSSFTGKPSVLLSVPAAGAGFPHPRKVAVVVLENRSYGQVIGSRDAPYLNRLAARNALATRYYAVTHPSLPNYIALTTGSMGEINKNCTGCDSEARNLVGQLDRAGISWRAYFDGLTSSARPGAITGTYNPHYNPFVYFESLERNSSARSRVVSFSGLDRDLRRRRLPRFTWIAPSVGNDGHNGSLRRADRYASRLVPKVLSALGPNGVLYLLWDEGAPTDKAGVGESPGGGKVVLIAAGGAARPAATTAVPANHYALLRTIEANFDLRTIGRAGSPSTPVLSGLLKPSASR